MCSGGEVVVVVVSGDRLDRKTNELKTLLLKHGRALP